MLTSQLQIASYRSCLYPSTHLGEDTCIKLLHVSLHIVHTHCSMASDIEKIDHPPIAYKSHSAAHESLHGCVGLLFITSN